MTANFDFDIPIERRHGDSSKWRKYGDRDVIPMWVADMDYRSPPAVIEALQARAAHGVFGYAAPTEELIDVVLGRLRAHYGWTVAPEQLVWLPGLVSALNVCCRLLDADQQVITTTPVYHPFLQAPVNMDRELLTVPLAEHAGRWTLDSDRLDAAITPATRLLLLCNPHNPVGRIYDRAELAALAKLCERRDLIVCADEVHCELLLDTDKPHIPFVTLGPDAAARSITLMAPSKTFNLAGLYCGFAVIPDTGLRRRFRRAMAGIVGDVNIMGYTATLAAYRDGESWRRALLDYLRGNRQRLIDWAEATPNVILSPIEATYLAWIDCRERGLDDPATLFERYGVGLHDGRIFGAPPGFVRLNFGCTRALLDEALERMSRALENA